MQGGNIPYKICPSCGWRAPLDLQQCPQCSHAYRTQFINPNQTIAVGGLHPMQSMQPQLSMNPDAPLDVTEWRMKSIWLWLLSSFLLSIIIYSLVSLRNPYAPDSTHGFAIMIALFTGGGLIAATVKLRRLYTHHNVAGRTPWITLCVAGLFAIAALYSAWETVDKQITEDEADALKYQQLRDSYESDSNFVPFPSYGPR